MKYPRPPGPKGSPIFGVAVDFWRDSIASLQAWTREYGDVVYFRTGPYVVHFYFLNDPDAIREVLARQADQFERPALIKRFLGTFLGNGVLLSDGPTHERQRKMIFPALCPRSVKSYAECMVQCTQDMMDRWKPGDVIDIEPVMTGLALTIGCRTLFGKDADDIVDFVFDASEKAQRYINRIFRSFIPIPIWIPTPRNRALKASLREGDRIIMDLIAERRASGADEGDLLSMLLQADQAEGGADDKEIRDQVATLSMVGHETTATALTWTWYLLSLHPEVEAKLVAQVREVIGDRAPTVEDVPNLSYVNMVFRETLRLYPPVWIFSRTATADVDVGPVTIPKGGTVAVSPYITQRDPRYFDDPESFRPERFAPGTEEKINRYANFPFGAGQRGCLGENFAITEAVLILSAVVQRYRFSLAPGQAIATDPMITLRPRNGIRMQVQGRD